MWPPVLLHTKESVYLSKKLYVGNLSFETTEEEVRSLLAEFGTLESLAMINDRDTGRFRGFCFVELENDAAQAAIEALSGKEFNGRNITINEARARVERGGGSNRSNSKFPHSGGGRHN